MAERKGFEPLEAFTSTVFKTAAFDRSAISPYSVGLADCKAVLKTVVARSAVIYSVILSNAEFFVNYFLQPFEVLFPLVRLLPVPCSYQIHAFSFCII